MGLIDWIENIQFTHFMYLSLTSVALLIIGYVGKIVFVPQLGAVDPSAAFDTLMTFHNSLIIGGFVFLGLAIAAMVIFIEVS